MVTKDYTHCTLVGGTRVLWAKRHSCIAKTPNGVRNDVYFSLSEYILIWLYPEKPSIKDILSKPYLLSIMTSVMGNENLFLGEAILRSWKSIQIQIFLFFLSKGTMLATQSGCCSSRMKPYLMSFCTSASLASMMSGQNHRCYYLTGLASSLMLRWCMATWGSKPCMFS